MRGDRREAAGVEYHKMKTDTGTINKYDAARLKFFCLVGFVTAITKKNQKYGRILSSLLTLRHWYEYPEKSKKRKILGWTKQGSISPYISFTKKLRC